MVPERADRLPACSQAPSLLANAGVVYVLTRELTGWARLTAFVDRLLTGPLTSPGEVGILADRRSDPPGWARATAGVESTVRPRSIREQERDVTTMRYEAPETLDTAVALLAGARGDARVLAGGTDLLVQMRYDILDPELIVDIKRIPEIRAVTEEEGGWRIGAAVTGAELKEHAALGRAWPGVVEAANLIGSTLDRAAQERLEAAARAACRPIDDKRGTVEFRIEVAGVLTRRAALIALERAR